MNKKEFGELLKKCFGKGKDDRYHAIAMLIIYGVFILIVIAVVRLGGNNASLNTNKEIKNTPSPTVTPEAKKETTSDPTDISSDVNYSYSYTITFDGNTEVYLGKKIDDKEKFTLIKNGESKEYAILDGNYLKLEDGKYHITDKLDNYFKYCDITKTLTLIQNSIPTESSDSVIYSVTNYDISKQFGGNILETDSKTNKVEITSNNGVLKSIDLDYSNYISTLLNSSHTLKIKMELANIGTTDNFDIKLN